MKILIIDDDRITRKVIEKKMSFLNYQVKTASNAFEALSILEEEKFDLIISDIMMPTISGLSLVSVVKEFISRKIPIVIISSLNDDKTTQTCMRLGAAEFLSKPIDFEKLISICKKILQNNEH